MAASPKRMYVALWSSSLLDTDDNPSNYQTTNNNDYNDWIDGDGNYDDETLLEDLMSGPELDSLDEEVLHTATEGDNQLAEVTNEELDIFLDDYYPSNFAEEPYPEESGLGSFDDYFSNYSPTIPEEFEYEPIVVEADVSPAEIPEEDDIGWYDNERDAIHHRKPKPQSRLRQTTQMEESQTLAQQAEPAHTVQRHRSKPKIDAVTKQKALLSEIARRKQMEQQLLMKQERLNLIHREKLKRLVLENASKPRVPTVLASTQATKRNQVTKTKVQPLTEEEQQKMNTEKHQQIAALRKKFKEQHKRLLASLIQQKQAQKEKEQQSRETEEALKDKVRKAAEKQRMANLKHDADYNRRSPASTAAANTPSILGGSVHNISPATTASSAAVGSGVHAVRARSAGDAVQNNATSSPSAEMEAAASKADNVLIEKSSLIRDSTSAGAVTGTTDTEDKLAQQASMRKRRLRLRQYLTQMKENRRQKEVVAAKEQIRMQRRAELLEQRILSKSAGNLLGESSPGTKNVMEDSYNTVQRSDDELSSNDADGDAITNRDTNVGGSLNKTQPRKPTLNSAPRQPVNVPVKVAEPRDFASWKKKHGIPEDGKVFAMTGWYPCIKQCLLDRGWYFNPDRESIHFDLKWTIKSHDLKQDLLQPWQLANHFFRNTVLTTKAGLLHSLRNLSWVANVSSDHIHPRAYDLNSPAELQGFVTDYRCLKAESILKAIYHDLTGMDQPPCDTPLDSARSTTPIDSPTASMVEQEPPCPTPIVPLETYMVNQVVLAAACNFCRRQQRYLEDGFLDEPSDEAEPLMTELEWEVLSTCSVCSTGTLPAQPSKAIECEIPTSDGDSTTAMNKLKNRKRWNKYWKSRQALSEQLNHLNPISLVQLHEIHDLLNGLRKLNPQFALNGLGKKCSNLWVVKPAAKARGQGIRTFRQLKELLEYIGLKERNTNTPAQWVVQKYIEHPLIIANRKFDLRQWVLVTSWNPLTVYFYRSCYLRFGIEPYSTEDDDLGNQYVHLVNNSIGKHSEHFAKTITEDVTGREMSGYMLASADFAEYLRISTGEDLFHTKIQPQMKNIARWASMCAVDGVEHRKNSWELFGYDFMVDSHYKLWLIEVNSSPACDYSTEVAKQYVQAALQDIIKVVLDRREWECLPKQERGEEPDIGGWELIHKGIFLETPISAFGAEFSLKGEALEVPKPRKVAPPVPVFEKRHVPRSTTNSAVNRGEQPAGTNDANMAAAVPTVQLAVLDVNSTHAPQNVSVTNRTWVAQPPGAPSVRTSIGAVSSESVAADNATSLPQPIPTFPETTDSSPLDGMMLMGRSININTKPH